MSSGSHITRYSVMPIPPVEAHTRYFRAGALRLGVEYRLLTDAVAAAAELESAGEQVRRIGAVEAGSSGVRYG